MADFLDVLRTEKKYTISPITMSRLKSRLSYILPLDRNCIGAKPYIVKSLYFDSLYNRDYTEKEAGLEFRKKIRLRSYARGNIVKLEWKRKQGSKQRKQSLIINKEDAKELVCGHYNCLLKYKDDLAGKFYTMMNEEVYIPRCMVVYKRLAFTLPTNDIRITIDSDISSNEGMYNIFDENLSIYPTQSFGNAVLEVKFNHFLLDYIRKILSLDNLTESANSKYTAGRYFGFKGVKL